MSGLVGTGDLARLALRRDRVWAPSWVLAVVVMCGYMVAGISIAYPTDRDLGAIVSFVQGPAGTIMSGPGYGLDEPTHASVFAAVYGLYVFILAAFMNVLLVVRHTRADEESGRTELLRAGVVSRHASLAAVGATAVLADVVLAVLIAAALSGPFGVAGAVLFGASVGSVGLAFAGIAAVVVQVSESTRMATGLGSAVIGIAVVVRGASDVLGENGSPLSWFSPLAWAQQTRVFVDPRAWPLLPCVALAAVCFAAGAMLQGRRDVGAGLVAARPGRRTASARLSSVWALGLRLERSAIVGWSLGVGVVGLLYGALTDSVQSSFADLPDTIVAVLGGDASQLLDGFVSTMVLFNAVLAASCGVVVMHRLTTEEVSARTEMVLSTATSRTRWMGAGLVTSLVAVSCVLVVGGVGMGASTAIALGDGSRLPQVLAAHLAYLPAVAVVVAIAGLGHAIRPRWVDAAWVVVAWCVVVGFFGALLHLPATATDLSPFSQVARAPLEHIDPWSLSSLAALALAVGAAALAVFRRRDISGG